MSRADELRAWALDKVGCGYVWGARGETCTASLLARLQEQYPAQTNISTVCRKWIGKPVYDCATLVRYGLAHVGISICSGASSQWRGDYWEAKGPTADMPPDMVCILYNASANANPMGHTGIYLGDGYAVDARSSAKGVMRSALGSRAWSHYAIPRGLYDQPDNTITQEADKPMQLIVTADKGSTVRLRMRPDDTAPILANVPLGTALTVEEQTDTWCRVVYGDFRGYMMSKHLAAVAGQAEPTLEQRVATLEAWVAAHDGGGVQG